MPGIIEQSDDIVISGISGRFPESANMLEFQKNLLAHVNMVTVNERRFTPGIYGIPAGFGTLTELDKFDAEFFKVLPNQAQRMDPQLRITMETTYEAMMDAGVNPSDERGTRTGVFLGVCLSEGSILWNNQPNRIEGATMTGCSHSMFANRVSYAFDFKGPSCAYDTACSTSIFALEAAISAMKAGKCDAAIVTASTLILTPHTNMQFDKLGMLAKDSTCKAFDQSGDGYVRAEAVATIYLQKASCAKRNYATVLHVKTNTDGYKDGGVTYPSAMMQEELLTEIYHEAGVNPDEVAYIEAHGTGTSVGDPLELLALSKVFRTGSRSRPLLIGSVKSNMGHSEGASGVCGIAKIITILQTGIIPANLHFEEPHFKMNSVRNGIIQIVNQNTLFEGGLIGLNSFGFGGVNTHVILKPHVNPELSTKIPENVPKLVTMSGRSEDGVTEALKMINLVGSAGQATLVNEANKTPSQSHLSVRGFTTFGSDTVEIQSVVQEPGQVWFVFNGMGSQWAGMGRDMLEVPTFLKSIEASATTLLKHFKFDLMTLLHSAEPSAFETPTNAFVSIAAIQIAFVDTLAHLGIRSNGLLGHSAGELLCAYADECLTAEQTIIAAYYRGQTLTQTKVQGSDQPEFGMAAVGLSWEEAKKAVPKGVHAACHNAVDNVTVSGPKPLVSKFVEQLLEKKKTAKVVSSCGIAFHSPYIRDASVSLLAALKDVIPNPKARSENWISTSIPEGQWGHGLHLKASPEYIVNNFLSPVLFYDTVRKIPERSTVIEIGPSGLLRGLIKRAAPTSTVIPLQSRDGVGLKDFVTALGKMYLAQVHFDANKLMGQTVFPVPVETPMVGHLMSWDHSATWDVPVYGKNGEFQEGVFDIDMTTEADSYLFGHVLLSRVLFPATGYMVLVWKFFAQMHQTPFESFPVVFEKVKFNRVTILGNQTKVEFRIHISDISGTFEIIEGGAAICTGVIRRYEEDAREQMMQEQEFLALESGEAERLADLDTPLLGSHIYKRLRFVGYEYQGLFRGIEKSDLEGSSFQVTWNDNWVSFLDTFLQTSLHIFGLKHSQTELPTEIAKVVLDPAKFLEYFATENTEVERPTGIFVTHNKNTGMIKCRGIEVQCVKTTPIKSNTKEPAPTLSTYSFVPYFDLGDIPSLPLPEFGKAVESGLSPTLQCMAIIMENMSSRMVKETPTIVEFTQKPVDSETLAISNCVRVNFSTPDIEYILIAEDCPDEMEAAFAKSHITHKDFLSLRNEPELIEKRFDVIILDNHMLLHMALDYARKGGWLLLKVGHQVIGTERVIEKIGEKWHLIAKKQTDSHVVYLIRKDTKQSVDKISVIPISSTDLSWVSTLSDLLIHHEDVTTITGNRPPPIYLVSNGPAEEDSGLLGLILCLRKEPFTQQLRSIFCRTQTTLDFNNPNPQLARILAHDLVVNVLDENDDWGYYLHAPIGQVRQKLGYGNAFVKQGIVGDLTTLNWVEGFEFKKMAAARPDLDYKPVRVHYAALNFKDIMLASGNLQPEKKRLPYQIDSPLGFEFSGVVDDEGDDKAGVVRRVFGFSEGQALATQVYANTDSLWTIPEHWSFEDAATVPAVYSTVYFALIMRGQMKHGESILVHAGAGGVGQAAIRVALSMNCSVFTTVGSKEKVAFIKKEFPQIPECNISSSRDTDFEAVVLNVTNGRGVDVVLNSLTGEKLQASVRCIARHGRFLEIGKVDLVANKNLGMDLFLKDASFHGIMLDSMFDCRAEARAELKQLIQNGIDSGVIQPLPRRVYDIQQVEPSFRYMGQGRHIGKVLLQIRLDDQKLVEIPSAPYAYFDPNKSYIIIGGLGGFGLELAHWMTTRYARKLVLTTRTGITNAYQQKYVEQWKAAGVAVKVLTLDASNLADAEKLVLETLEMGPIGGYFNLAMQLKIGLMKLQTEYDFFCALAPKVDLTRNIDALTRRLCPEGLDYFVVFSSVASGFGFDGQSNYGMANSALERICEMRVRDGLSGKAIQWGPIGEVGAWHDTYNSDFQRQSFHGSGVQSIQSALKSLDVLLSHPACVMLSRRTIDVNMDGVLSQELSIMERIAHILGHSNLGKVNPKSKLTELGMDSVMAMEVKQVLEQDFQLALSAAEIRSCTLGQLTDMGKNTDKNRVSSASVRPRAATADLFQLNFMKSLSRSRFMHTQCVYPLNAVTDRSRGSIFICNSIEGPDILRILGSLLTRPAYSMQFVEDAPMSSLDAMTEYFLTQLKAVEPVGPYLIVGYSAGIFVGIELAIKLAATKENDKMMLMDMTPARYHAIVEENLGTDRSNLDEVDIIAMLFSQIFGFDRESLERMLKSVPDRESRFKKMTELASTLFDEPIDLEVVQKYMTSSGKEMIEMFENYAPSGKYHGEVVLVRTTQNLISYDSNEFWGLEEFCTQTPKVLVLDTTHSYMVAEPAVRDLALAMNE